MKRRKYPYVLMILLGLFVTPIAPVACDVATTNLRSVTSDLATASASGVILGMAIVLCGVGLCVAGLIYIVEGPFD